METQQRSKWIWPGTAAALGAVIALAAFSGPSEPAPAPAPTAVESTPRWSGDPSLAGLSVAADAEPGDIEIFY